MAATWTGTQFVVKFPNDTWTWYVDAVPDDLPKGSQIWPYTVSGSGPFPPAPPEPMTQDQLIARSQVLKQSFAMKRSSFAPPTTV
ncbi:MAG: hypothetical protein C0501_25850 [Isosphaera sp.]|nr:hypothetical protein [Isosphaera sp.]